MKIITVIKLVYACVKTSAEEDDFQRLSKGEWSVCIYLERFHVLVCHITLFRVSFGLLDINF